MNWRNWRLRFGFNLREGLVLYQTSFDDAGRTRPILYRASVSEVHGNFIINDGTATARDVLSLIEVVRERVRAARGIELETEVEILGEG